MRDSEGQHMKLIIAFLKNLVDYACQIPGNIAHERALRSKNIPGHLIKILAILRKIGAISHMGFSRPVPRWPHTFLFYISDYSQRQAVGFSFDRTVAMEKAVGEFVERYSLRTIPYERLLRGSYKDLESSGAINPTLLSPFSPQELLREEYKECRILDESVFLWAPCTEFVTSTKYLIPAQLAFLGYARLKEEPVIREMTSSGAAAGTSAEMAQLNSIYELIERDAFMKMWMRAEPPPRIDISRIRNNETARIMREYEKLGLEAKIFEITSDNGIPTVMTILSHNLLAPVFVDTHTDLNMIEAVNKSLIGGLRLGYTTPQKKMRAPSAKIQTIEDRRAYWYDLSHRDQLKFLSDTRPSIATGNNVAKEKSAAEQLEEVRSRIARHGLRIYQTDVLPETLRTSGYNALISISPDLCPIYFDETRKFDAFPSSSLRHDPHKQVKNRNTAPHPFL